MRAAVVVLMLLSAARAGPDPRADMLAIERETERLAHALLDLSEALRAGDAGAAGRSFAHEIPVSGFPPRRQEARELPVGIRSVRWAAGPGAAKGPEAAAAALLGLLADCATSRWVLLKPVASERRDGRLRATLALRAGGRRADGAVVWLRGELESVVADGPRLAELRLVRLETVERAAPLFTDVTAEAGIERADPPVLEHPTLGLAAYGAAAGDLDGDGRIDLFVTAHDGNHALLNRGPDGFEERAVRTRRPATAPLLLDHDNDGDLDVFLSANGPQMLLENELVPTGRFALRDVSEAMGVAVPTIGFSVAAADVNGDARPDVYVAAYNDYGPVAPESWVDGRNGLPNLFFVSRPDGTYEEAAARWGVADARWSYAAQFADVDADGKVDLYVANDFGGGNALFLRRGDRFVDEARARGVSDDGYAMGVAFGDYDNDGLLDLHVTRMSSTAGRRILRRFRAADLPDLPVLLHLSAGNGLYRNQGGGVFRDVTDEAGPFPAGWAWGGGFVDVDNDGREDLFTPNGHLSGGAMKDT